MDTETKTALEDIANKFHVAIPEVERRFEYYLRQTQDEVRELYGARQIYSPDEYSIIAAERVKDHYKICMPRRLILDSDGEDDFTATTLVFNNRTPKVPMSSYKLNVQAR